jgi:predicted GIY-YIG superfamily endonuclease
MKEGTILNNSGVYIIRCNENGKIYVGSASNFNERKGKHWSSKLLGGGYDDWIREGEVG